LTTEKSERRERETPQQARKRWARKIVAVLKASREDADVSRTELAEWLGFTVNQVANLEYGRRELRVIDLIMIAQALRLDPETLFRRILRW
jgi:transcriptional regulator with XRE-family HTH domain